MLTVIVEADGQPQRVLRIARMPCRIGRQRDLEVVLPSWRVARVHAEIHRSDRAFRLVDCGSLGGSWVNGERTVEFGPLAESDEIGIAGFRLRVVPDDGFPDLESRPWRPEPFTGSTTDRFQEDGDSASGLRSPARDRAWDGDTAAANRSGTPVRIGSEHRPVIGPGVDAVGGPGAEGGPPAASRAAIEPIRPGVDPLLEWRRVLHRRLLQTLDLRRRDIRQLDTAQLRAETADLLRELLADEVRVPASVDTEVLITQVLDEAIGLGPLEPLLEDPSVTEIMVNCADEIYVEREGRLTRSPHVFSGEPAIRAVIDRIVAPLGRRIDESMPMVDARLDDGSRVNAIIPPLAVRGSAVTIRRFNRQVFSVDDLLARGSVSAAMVALLRICVQCRRNVVISGGTGSGKTTLLNVLSNLIPEGERVVTIEDAAELRLNHAHLVSLEARPPNAEGRGTVTIRDLVRNALRMRPDRIVVGECRGGEALDMLQAMNTGHDGSLTTVHANSPRDVVARLETMVLMAGMDLPVAAIRDQIASAVHVIVHQARSADGRRRITEIAEVTGVEGSRVQMQSLLRHENGRFVHCGNVPQFFESLRAAGIEIDPGLLEGDR